MSPDLPVATTMLHFLPGYVKEHRLECTPTARQLRTTVLAFIHSNSFFSNTSNSGNNSNSMNSPVTRLVPVGLGPPRKLLRPPEIKPTETCLALKVSVLPSHTAPMLLYGPLCPPSSNINCSNVKNSYSNSSNSSNCNINFSNVKSSTNNSSNRSSLTSTAVSK